MNIIDFFQKHGKPIVVEGNKPLLLSDPHSAWLVKRGKVTVFGAPVDSDGITGARDYILQAQTGEILLGLSPGEITGRTNHFCLLAAGLPGTELWQIPMDLLLQQLNQPTSRDVLIPLLEQWVKSLAKGVNAAGAPAVQLHIDSGAPVRVQMEDNAAPVTLDVYHRQVLQAAICNRKLREEEQRRRLEKKLAISSLHMENAIKDMASVAQPELRDSVQEQISGDSLFAACRLVGQAMQINIIHPPRAAGGIAAKNPLDEIARASRIRVRQVALKGEWYHQDNGPLLAYMEEDNRPVALIPVTPTIYKLHDPTNNTTAPVNAQTARQLKPFALAFYRPFPQKVLRLRDILTFGYKGCWKRDLWLVILMGLAGGVLGMVIPLATGIIFDTIIPGGEKAQLLQVAFFLGASALAGLLFQLTRSLALLRLEGKMEGAVQPAMWDRLLSLPVPFFKDYNAGELAMRAMGVSQIRMILSGIVINDIVSGFFSLFNLGLMFYYHVKLAALSAVITVVAVLFMVLLGYRQVHYERQVLDITNRISGLMLQLLSGITKFKAAGAENKAFTLITRDFSEQRRVQYKSHLLGVQMTTFQAVLPVLTSIVIFYAAAAWTDNILGAGKFVAFNSALVSFLGSMLLLGQSILTINMVIPLYERAKPILEALPEYDDDKSDPGELTGTIEVSHLSFRYSEDGPLVLDDISLTVSEGEYIGIVGASGSGKSTLLRALLGFEKPSTGQIFYNGQALDKLDIRQVRRQLGVVLQNGQLMAGDIFTNIVGANYTLTMDDAWEAAKMAGLDRDIQDMPMGMFTVVSEGSSTLSGGQRQRLLIARAIVNKPKIIFFDEATSALDNQTQAIVSSSLDKLKATRLVIAHRLSTIANCDRILVLDKGKLVESGTYRALIDKGGFFAELARRQLA